MFFCTDINEREIRFTNERKNHLESTHPEMVKQLDKIYETLRTPDSIIRSNIVSEVELFYKFYQATPVTSKHLCVVVKFTSSPLIDDDNFIITAYFTDRIKKGEILWKRK